MDYWQGVASRMNIPGIILIVLGAAISFGAQKLALHVLKDENKTLLLKMAGLVLVIAGALIVLI